MTTKKRMIYADEALEAVCYNCMDKYNCQDRCSDYMEVFDIPTVDAVPVVHGRWEDAHEIKSFRHTNIPVVQCSECKVYFCDIINNHHYMYNYCPNCGARMDGDSQ